MALLFSKIDLAVYAERIVSNGLAAVDTLPSAELTSEEDALVTRITDLTAPRRLVIGEPLDPHVEDCQLDARQDPMHLIVNRSHPALIPGIRVIYGVPFEGAKDLFDVRPTGFTLNPPAVAAVSDSILTYIYEYFADAKLQADAIKARLRQDIAALSPWIGWINHDVDELRRTVEQRVRVALQRRKSGLAQAQRLAQELRGE